MNFRTKTSRMLKTIVWGGRLSYNNGETNRETHKHIKGHINQNEMFMQIHG